MSLTSFLTSFKCLTEDTYVEASVVVALSLNLIVLYQWLKDSFAMWEFGVCLDECSFMLVRAELGVKQ